MAKKKINDIIQELSGDFMKANQLEFYNIEFVKEGRDWFLRVYIDKDNGSEDEYISTDDCEKVSRYLSKKLDEVDPIEQNYYLEVSSPGMDRQLLEQRHYDKYVGKLVDVKLYKGFDGKKHYEGILVGLIDGNVIIKDEKDEEIMFPLEQVAKVNLSVVF